VELPIKPDGSNGEIDLETWLGDHPTRRYSGLGYNLPQVSGTAKCQSGTYTWSFGPHTFFDTLGGGMVKGDAQRTASCRAASQATSTPAAHAT